MLFEAHFKTLNQVNKSLNSRLYWWLFLNICVSFKNSWREWGGGRGGGKVHLILPKSVVMRLFDGTREGCHIVSSILSFWFSSVFSSRMSEKYTSVRNSKLSCSLNWSVQNVWSGSCYGTTRWYDPADYFAGQSFSHDEKNVIKHHVETFRC